MTVMVGYMIRTVVDLLRTLLLHPGALYLAIALTVWIPSGFNIGPVNDGWFELGGGATLIRVGYTVNFGHFPVGLGLRLVGDGFQGWQAVILALTVLRGYLVYAIVRRMFPAQILFSIASGVIALFHPADTSYFWPGGTGNLFAWALALACCLSAVVHLETKSRESLVSLYFFQIILCLTYAAFHFLLLALPAAYWLLRRSRGYRESWSYLVRTSLVIVVFILYQSIMAHIGVGREGHILDLDPWRALAGYGFEAKALVTGLAAALRNFQPVHLSMALVTGLYAYILVSRLRPGDVDNLGAPSMLACAALALALLILAVLSYFPYAISEDRFANDRQMLAAGTFMYMIGLIPVFVRPWGALRRRTVSLAAIVLLTAGVTIVGAEDRAPFVAEYRAQERFLGALAAALPHPAPHTLIVVELHDPVPKTLSQFDIRWPTFKNAVRFLYNDPSLNTALIDPGLVNRPMEFTSAGVVINVNNPINRGWHSDLKDLVVLEYSSNGTMRILGRDAMKAWAPPGEVLDTYAPERFLGPPAPMAHVCTMLEPVIRPDYCH